MIRSGTVKNVLFVIMVASTYMTIRLTMMNRSIKDNKGSILPVDVVDQSPGQKVLPGPKVPLVKVIKPPEKVEPAHNVQVPQEVKQQVVTVKPVVQNNDVKCTSDLLGTPNSILQHNPSLRDITCDKLLNAKDHNDKVYSKAKQFQEKYKVTKISDDQFIRSTYGCKEFLASHGYHMNHGTEEERNFPIAYNILMHKDIQQVEILLRSLYRPQNVFCIHIDDKQSDKLKQAVRSLTKCFNNVYIASKLEKIVYAGFTRLQADINCMKDHLKQPIKWKYLFNIAAQSFPLKTNLEMVEILGLYNGSNDIEGIYGARIHRGRYKLRFELEWNEVNVGTNQGKIVRTGKNNPPPPDNIDIIRGSAYGIFSRDFVHFIVNDQKAKNLLEWSRKTFSPDEHYWATLHHTYTNPHLHTPGGYSGKPDEKPWLAVWVAWGGVDKCHGRWVRGTCVFGVQDLPMLKSRHEFFANKFYYNERPLVLECLNNWLEYKVKCPQPIDWKYYNNLPFIKKPT